MFVVSISKECCRSNDDFALFEVLGDKDPVGVGYKVSWWMVALLSAVGPGKGGGGGVGHGGDEGKNLRWTKKRTTNRTWLWSHDGRPIAYLRSLCAGTHLTTTTRSRCQEGHDEQHT